MAKDELAGFTCQREVGDPPHYLHWHPCGKKAKVKRGDEYFCKRHDPVEIEKRDSVKRDKFNAEMKQRRLDHEDQMVGTLIRKYLGITGEPTADQVLAVLQTRMISQHDKGIINAIREA